MPFVPPALDSTSPLLQTALEDDRFHVADYIGEGAFPGHRAEKDEADAYVLVVMGALRSGAASGLAEDLGHYLRAGSGPTSWRQP